MNRETKFRGKSLTTSEWLYGSLFNDGAEDYILPNLPSGALDYEDYQIDSNTIGQFTGVKDKKGKEVFEGDIVEVTCLEVSQYGRKMLCSIVYYSGFACYCFKASDRIRCMISTIPNAEIEVIGNRFENPELLSE